MDGIEKDFTMTCDFFMLDREDEMRKSSAKFFKFFIEYFDDVHKCLEVKNASKVGAAKPGPPKRFNPMADIMAKNKLQK